MKKAIVILILALIYHPIFSQLSSEREARAYYNNKFSVGMNIGFPLLTYSGGKEKAMENQGFNEKS